MKKILFLPLVFILSFTLFPWEIEYIWKDIDLKGKEIPGGYVFLSGKGEIRGGYKREGGITEWKSEGRIENAKLALPKEKGIVSLPLVKFALSPTEWIVSEGKGTWEGIDFEVKGKGKYSPFTYNLIVSLPGFSAEKIKKIFPTWKIPEWCYSLCGDLSLTIYGGKKPPLRGKVDMKFLEGDFEKIQVIFKWNKGKVEIQNFSLQVSPGKIQGKGEINWIIPKP
ncbi:hypothetical protein J7K56_03720 [Candidatus Calescamantes bacterium]|nr:hypothetical protein [Candidatus Calescamantes bacterium]